MSLIDKILESREKLAEPKIPESEPSGASGSGEVYGPSPAPKKPPIPSLKELLGPSGPHGFGGIGGNKKDYKTGGGFGGEPGSFRTASSFGGRAGPGNVGDPGIDWSQGPKPKPEPIGGSAKGGAKGPETPGGSPRDAKMASKEKAEAEIKRQREQYEAQRKALPHLQEGRYAPDSGEFVDDGEESLYKKQFGKKQDLAISDPQSGKYAQEGLGIADPRETLRMKEAELLHSLPELMKEASTPEGAAQFQAALATLSAFSTYSDEVARDPSRTPIQEAADNQALMQAATNTPDAFLSSAQRKRVEAARGQQVDEQVDKYFRERGIDQANTLELGEIAQRYKAEDRAADFGNVKELRYTDQAIQQKLMQFRARLDQASQDHMMGLQVWMDKLIGDQRLGRDIQQMIAQTIQQQTLDFSRHQLGMETMERQGQIARENATHGGNIARQNLTHEYDLRGKYADKQFQQEQTLLDLKGRFEVEMEAAKALGDLQKEGELQSAWAGIVVHQAMQKDAEAEQPLVSAGTPGETTGKTLAEYVKSVFTGGVLGDLTKSDEEILREEYEKGPPTPQSQKAVQQRIEKRAANRELIYYTLRDRFLRTPEEQWPMVADQLLQEVNRIQSAVMEVSGHLQKAEKETLGGERIPGGADTSAGGTEHANRTALISDRMSAALSDARQYISQMVAPVQNEVREHNQAINAARTWWSVSKLLQEDDPARKRGFRGQFVVQPEDANAFRKAFAPDVLDKLKQIQVRLLDPNADVEESSKAQKDLMSLVNKAGLDEVPAMLMRGLETQNLNMWTNAAAYEKNQMFASPVGSVLEWAASATPDITPDFLWPEAFTSPRRPFAQ